MAQDGIVLTGPALSSAVNLGRIEHGVASQSKAETDRYNEAVVKEAFAAVVKGKRCKQEELPAVIQACVVDRRTGARRRPTDDELKAVVRDLQRLGTAPWSAGQVSRALYGISTLRILSRHDYWFSRVHDGRSRAEVLHSMERTVDGFMWANCAMLLLAPIVLGVAMVERMTVNVFPEAIGLAIIAGILIVCGVIGIVGASRLRPDLEEDNDGRETPAQQMIEVYFWVVGLLSMGVLLLATLWLSLPSQVPPRRMPPAAHFALPPLPLGRDAPSAPP